MIAAAAVVTTLGVLGASRIVRRADSAPAKATRPAVPVYVETARTLDVPAVTRGIGTVQSLHDVTIRAQLEGVLVEVLFREGQTVKRGDLLARIDDRAIAAAAAEARAEKRRNEAQLAAAKLDLIRYSNLWKEEAIARQTVDQQAALVAQLEATVGANAAAIAAAEARLSYARIVSPVDGRVGLRRIDAGNVVRPTDPEGLVSVTQLDPIAVVFALPQEVLPTVQALLHGPEPAPVIAYDRPSGAALAQGHLQMMDNQIDRTTGTIRLKAEFPNPEEKLWPGQSVSVELQTGFSAGATVVSLKAVQRGRTGPFVYRVIDGIAKMVPVQLGPEHGEVVVILEGVAPGDVVVRDGQSRVIPGAPVQAVSASEGGES